MAGMGLQVSPEHLPWGDFVAENIVNEVFVIKGMEWLFI
jgi:hypothetical protein